MIFGDTICMEILLTVLGIIQTVRRRKGKLKTSDKPILSAVILVASLYIQFGIILGMTLGARSSWVEVTGEYIVTTLFVLCFGLISAIDADITKKRKELYKVMQILPVFDIISMMILLIKYRKISDPAETTSLE